MNLTTNVTGLELKNPTILAAGILGTTAASLKRVMQGGAGAVVTKSIGSAPRTGHPGPVVTEREYGILNAMGLPNPSYRDFVRELALAKGDVPVIASIFGANASEFQEVAHGLNDAEPDGFELNVSCPHAKGYGASIASDSDAIRETTEAVKDIVEVPVWVKLAPLTNIVEMGLAAQEGGADAVVAINTVPAMAIDVESGLPLLGNKVGGISGPAIKPIALKCVYELYSALNIDVIGVGGITNWSDAIEFIMAGAKAVQIGSAVYNDIGVFKDVSDGVARHLKENRRSLKNIRGVAHK